MAGAPRVAFDVVLVSLFGIITIYSVLLVDAIARQLSRGTGPWLAAVGAFLYVPLALGFVRPRWFTRLGAGRDGTAPVRFLLTWLRREWASLDVVDRSGPGLIGVVERELGRVRDPSNAMLVDEGVVILETYLRKVRIGQTSGQKADRELIDRLNQVRPVDRLARVF